MKLLDDIRHRIQARRAKRARYICAPCSQAWRVPVEPDYGPGDKDPDIPVPEWGHIAATFPYQFCDICRRSRQLRQTRSQWLEQERTESARPRFFEAPE